MTKNNPTAKVDIIAAAKLSELDTLERGLAQGENIERRDCDEMTALMCVAEAASAECLAALMRAGAKIDGADRDGSSASRSGRSLPPKCGQPNCSLPGSSKRLSERCGSVRYARGHNRNGARPDASLQTDRYRTGYGACDEATRHMYRCSKLHEAGAGQRGAGFVGYRARIWRCREDPTDRSRNGRRALNQRLNDFSASVWTSAKIVCR
jgi:hypothetical protein